MKRGSGGFQARKNYECWYSLKSFFLGATDSNILIEGSEEQATAYYHKLVTDVIAHVPPERLLIFEAEDGWAPLCKFLGVPEPDEPYPRTNDTKQMLNMIKVVLDLLAFL